jgi:hypothetical protein
MESGVDINVHHGQISYMYNNIVFITDYFIMMCTHGSSLYELVNTKPEVRAMFRVYWLQSMTTKLLFLLRKLRLVQHLPYYRRSLPILTALLVHIKEMKLDLNNEKMFTCLNCFNSACLDWSRLFRLLG